MLNDKIDSLIQESRKSGEKSKLKVLQLIKAQFQSFLTSKKGAKLTKEQEAKILLKMAEQWKDEYNILLKNNRDTSVIIDEIDILMHFVPEIPTEEEIQEHTKGLFEAYKERYPDVCMKDLKPIMNQVKQKYPLADGGIIAKTFKELLNK